jgi:catechol 2,3-dioxygenase-like lactoylglutathione lyase family enzyme
MKIKEGNITINVMEMDKSISFYESLGLVVQKRWGNHYAQLSAPGILIGLHPITEKNSMGSSGNVSIGFTTDDFAGARSLLDDQSIAVVERQEEGGRFLHFSDPDGTALYFIDPKW